jgi:hypothetical protein
MINQANLLWDQLQAAVLVHLQLSLHGFIGYSRSPSKLKREFIISGYGIAHTLALMKQ